MIQYRDLIPPSINNEDYSDLFDVFQDFVDNELDIPGKFAQGKLIDQSDTDLQNWIYFTGKDLTIGDGYTSTRLYFQREFQSARPLVIKKHTRPGYDYLFYIFQVWAEVFPLAITSENFLEPFLTEFIYEQTFTELGLDEGFDAEGNAIDGTTDLTLDQKEITPTPVPDTLDSLGDVLDNNEFLDVIGFIQEEVLKPEWTLDNNDTLGSLTKHLLILYRNRWVENSTEFMSLDTARAFYNDVLQHKRINEIPHFMPDTHITSGAVGSPTVENITSEDGTITSTIESVHIFRSMLYAYTVEFGNGAVEDLSTLTNMSVPITTPLFTLPLQDQIAAKVTVQTETEIRFRTKIFSNSKFIESANPVTEMAIKDNIGRLIYYAKFPAIVFYNEMNSGVSFRLIINSV